MMFSTVSVLLVLPVLVSCQNSPINITGVNGGIPSDSDAVLYYNAASRGPSIINSHYFQGFNLDVPITNSLTPGDPNQSTNSTTPWTLLTNYYRLEVPTSNGNVTTGNTQFALAFPQQQWPLNDTDWQLCASYLLDNFPASISNKRENDTSADCGQYLGEACVTAWSQAYRHALSLQSVGCPLMPGLSSIKECNSQLGGTNVGSVGTGGPISNTTASGLIYYAANSSYVNPRTGQTYNSTTVPRQGLSWGQFFAYRRTGFFSNSPNVNSSLLAEGRQLRLVGLSLGPSDAFKRNNTAYGYQPNVRMLCVRADTSAATVLGPQAVSILVVCTALVASLVTAL